MFLGIYNKLALTTEIHSFYFFLTTWQGDLQAVSLHEKKNLQIFNEILHCTSKNTEIITQNTITSNFVTPLDKVNTQY